jgi:hypothetical protein
MYFVLVRPVGARQVVEYPWRQMLDEARRMAAHLKSLDFEPGEPPLNIVHRDN